MEQVEVLVDGFLTRTRDERTIGWPLVDFYPALGAAAFYCVLVFILPRVLRPAAASRPAAAGARKSAGDEETKDLRSIRLVYNGLMSLFNLYLVIEMARQAALTSWFGAITPGEQGFGVRDSPPFALLFPFLAFISFRLFRFVSFYLNAFRRWSKCCTCTTSAKPSNGSTPYVIPPS
jgi:hypothetical protein